MKGFRISTTSLAIAMISIFILSTFVSAVNSFSFTGPDDDGGFNVYFKGGAKHANDELNDYYNGEYDHFRKDINGLNPWKCIKEFQYYQPQWYVFTGHGVKNVQGEFGQEVRVRSNMPDTLDAAWWSLPNSGIQNDEKNTYAYPPGPFSTIIYYSCKSGVFDAWPDTIYKAAAGELGAWIFIGNLGKPSAIQCKEFIHQFTDRCTDGTKSYRDAFKSAKNKIGTKGVNQGKPYMMGRSGWEYGHTTRYDKYRTLNHAHSADTDEVIDKGDSASVIFYRRKQFNTNGAFVVFHGIVNDDLSDTTNIGEIEMNIQYWSSGFNKWVNIQTRHTTVWDIKNHGTAPHMGGSDICSVYVNRQDLLFRVTNYGYLKATVTFTSNDPETDDLRITRLEVMEMGM